MTEFISKEGRKRLKRVARWLEAGAPHVEEKHLDGFDMSIGVQHKPTCGTVCCIAGAVVQFSDPIEVEFGDQRPWTRIRWAAQDLLGISDDDCDALFTPHGFADLDEQDAFTPAHAAVVIRDYLATGNVDWSTRDV